MNTSILDPQMADTYQASTTAKPSPSLGKRATSIDFQTVNERASEWTLEILKEIAPEGEEKGSEYLMLNPHRNDSRLGSFKFHIEKGAWSDFAAGDDAKGRDLVSLVA